MRNPSIPTVVETKPGGLQRPIAEVGAAKLADRDGSWTAIALKRLKALIIKQRPDREIKQHSNQG